MDTTLTELFNTSELSLNTAFSPVQILLSFTITFVMALFIYWVYQKTYNGVLYSKNFNITLVMIALVVNAIIVALSGNIILSLGLVGALSIIRFRTAVKDPKDTAFLFWSLTIGIVNGVAYYQLAVIASLFIAVAVFILSRVSVFEPSYVMVLKYAPGAYEDIDRVLQKSFKRHHIRSDMQSDGIIERVIEIKLDSNKTFDGALQQIRDITKVKSCVLLSSTGDFAE